MVHSAVLLSAMGLLLAGSSGAPSLARQGAAESFAGEGRSHVSGRHQSPSLSPRVWGPPPQFSVVSQHVSLASQAETPPAAAAADDDSSRPHLRLEAQQQASPPASLETTSKVTNPWLSGELKAFIDKFDIPKVHGSGVYVDLGSSVSGYRQPAGLCPVFGKYIKMLKTGATTKTFLEDFPASGSSTRPLPGGLNVSFVGSSGLKFSPVKDQFIRDALGSDSPSTAIGRCAHYAFLTEARKPGTGETIPYKMPFVFDYASEDCYVLHVSIQQLKGSRYCSTNGTPAGMTWPCMQPEKSLDASASLVYGSAFVGRTAADSDLWQTQCPSKAVKDALFGRWNGTTCEPFAAEGEKETLEFSDKKTCWETLFLRAASDEPVSSNPNSWDSIWPTLDTTPTYSGGVGSNWANFVPKDGGGGTCVIVSSVPSCFSEAKGSVAYTALGSFEEEALPGAAGGGDGGTGGGGGGAGVGDEDAAEGGSKEGLVSPPGRDRDGWGAPFRVEGGQLAAALCCMHACAALYRHPSVPAAGSPHEVSVHHEKGGASPRKASEENVNLEDSFWRGEKEGLISAEYDR